jgi:hypothetical protein
MHSSADHFFQPGVKDRDHHSHRAAQFPLGCIAPVFLFSGINASAAGAIAV